ncbi:Y+L amino acid transporter 2 [Halocaridina rubra]|uniref:Y+L amino acid transporter 2 n=1 Tax=Halocaridina rubra TaxID=373956 RepID=A0AAN9A2D2_HALRR
MKRISLLKESPKPILLLFHSVLVLEHNISSQILPASSILHRLCFVGARQGHFPDCLALINYKCNTPTSSLVFLGALSLVYLCTTNIYSLIEYASFVESMFILFSIAGLLYMRWKRPEMERPIKVNILVPIAFLLICGFLVFLPFYVRPLEVGMGILITASGIPAYFLFVYWKNKPMIVQKMLRKLTYGTQILFFSVQED